MIAACSHLVLTSPDVPRITQFFESLFGVKPHFSNPEFVDFVLPGGFRIAFFKPLGTTTKYFSDHGERHFSSIGVTTADIQAIFERATSEPFRSLGVKVSGPPKEHPWGEKSFLLVDPDGNRWEVTESPSPSGMLVNRTRE